MTIFSRRGRVADGAEFLRTAIRGWRKNLSLSNQFLLAAGLVLCVSMTVLGTWVNHQITRSVLATSGSGGVAFMEAFIEPEIQGIRADGTLPPEAHLALDALLVEAPIGKSIVSVKLWKPDGAVIYSSMAKDVIGDHFVSTDVAKAASGKIVSEFEDMVSAESAYEQSLKMSLIEVYAPLYRTGTEEIIAVGEVYENGEALAAQLRVSRAQTWLVVCLTTLLMLSVLYGIVRRGSHTIAAQRAELQRQIAQVRRMASQNEELRILAEKTRLDANEANEELIGRIGLDIHDGPIQLLSLLMLRLGKLKSARPTEKDRAAIQELTATVIHELRTLSTGLVLPEIRDLSVEETIMLAAERHENLTGTKVAIELQRLPEALPLAMKICIYRIIQESLSNSFKHARGVGQKVRAAYSDDSIELTISDAGGGVAPEEIQKRQPTKLGLRGIQNRVQAFGGVAEVRSASVGTSVEVRLPLRSPMRRSEAVEAPGSPAQASLL
ncbi:MULTISPECIES: sensor histidine kinase [Chelativorans]|uniref:histidine kinase n=1 Tax=Chelativorans sp. (strain BNC1) TaxID=266779 RepID=Q11K80_CHESB|nr:MULTISPECIES: ATP-binding protein [Chelativorans]